MQAILSKLHAGGHFYKAQYRGFYSPKEETFLTGKDRRPDGTFDPGYGEVAELVEDNRSEPQEAVTVYRKMI